MAYVLNGVQSSSTRNNSSGGGVGAVGSQFTPAHSLLKVEQPFSSSLSPATVFGDLALVPESPDDALSPHSSPYLSDSSPLAHLEEGDMATGSSGSGADAAFRFDGASPNIFTPSEQRYFSDFLDQLANNDEARVMPALDGTFLHPMGQMSGTSPFRMPQADISTAQHTAYDDRSGSQFDLHMQAHWQQQQQQQQQLLQQQQHLQRHAAPPSSVNPYAMSDRSMLGTTQMSQVSGQVGPATPAPRNQRRTPARAPGGGVSKAGRVRSGSVGGNGTPPLNPAAIASAAAAAAAASNAAGGQTPLGLPIHPVLQSNVKPSLARGARPQKMEDEDEDDDLSDDALRNSQRELLTEEEKRQNHINSEKKRRNNIRQAFKTMTDIIPSLNGTNYSKATILNKANEYLVHLKERNSALSSEVYRLREMLEKRGIDSAGASAAPADPHASAAHNAAAVPASSGSTPEVSWSRGTPAFSDEVKIFVVWSCFLMAMVNPITGGGASGDDTSSSEVGRSLQSVAAPSSFDAAWPLLSAFASWFWVARWLFVALALYMSLTLDYFVKPNSKASQHAREYRLKGEKEPFFRREQYFLSALSSLGSPLPSTNVGLVMSLVWQVSRQLLHLLVFGRVVEAFLVRVRRVEPSVFELAHNFHALAHQYISSEAVPLKAWVSLLRALNLAECTSADNNPLLAEIYSSISFQVQFHLPNLWVFKRLARHYRARADAIRARADCSTKTLGYVSMHDAFEKMAKGHLTEAAVELRNVGRLFMDCGRHRSAWEVLVFYSLARHIRGEATETLKAAAEIRDVFSVHIREMARGDDAENGDVDPDTRNILVSQLLWSDMLSCLALLETLDVGQAAAVHARAADLAKMCRYDEAKWSESGHLQQVVYHALTTAVRGRQGDTKQMLAEATEAIKLFDNVQQPMFFGVSYLAYVLVADALVEAWLRAVDTADTDDVPTIAAMLAAVSSHLASFTSNFAFAEPRCLTVAGVAECLAAKDAATTESGRDKLRRAAAAGMRLDMPLDAAYAAFFYERFSDTPELEQITQARSVCHKLGAEHKANVIELYLHTNFGKRF